MSDLLTHLADEMPRYLLVGDLFALIVCGGVLIRAYAPAVGQAVDPILNALAVTFGVVFVIFAAAVVVNLTTPIPPTPGVKLAAALVTPCAVAVVAMTCRALTRRSP